MADKSRINSAVTIRLVTARTGEIHMENLFLQLLTLNEKENILEKADVVYDPFSATERSKADIHWLFKPDDTNSTGAALIKYYPGGNSPAHLHAGYELIYVLEGEMVTSQGKVRKGDLVLLPPNSVHQSSCEIGCTAFIIWEKPVIPIKEGANE